MATPKSMSQKDLKRLLTDPTKNVKIIDVRTKEEYEEQHIPGAVNVPVDQLEDFMSRKMDDATIVTVCNRGGNKSKEGASRCLVNSNEAYFLEDGTLGWFGNSINEK